MRTTYMAKQSDVERKWYVVDATDLVLGRLSVEIATVLRGKHKPTFTPHADCGDSVIVINASKIVLTGNKLNDKIYYHHTGYVGNMKAVKYGTLMKTKPEFVVEKAVKGMLPDNTIGRNAMTRIRIYAGAEHKQEAQKPIVREF